jgi:hypothetical protein
MAGSPYIPVRQVRVNSQGRPHAGARAYFYDAGTTTSRSVYTSAARTVAHTNPVVANSAGLFPAIYLDPQHNYRCITQTSAGIAIDDEDNIPGTGVTAEQVGLALYPRSNAEVSAGVTPSNYQYPPGNVLRYGAEGDGTTDDTAALATLATYVNAVTLSSRPVEVVIPPGVYLYSSALAFTRPVHISGHGATLNFTGITQALKLGADDIANFDVFFQGEYTVDGLRFTGGEEASHGIYINEHVVEPRIRNCTFEDYGNDASYDIYAQYENWNILIENCRKITYSSTTAVGNFIAIIGSSAGTADGGNSRCTIRDCWMTACDDQELGYFAYVNAVKCRIIGGGFQHSNGGILLGGLASATLIDGVYAEISTSTNPAYVSVYSSDAGGGAYHHPQQVVIRNGYVNMHSETITNTGRLIATQDANVKLINWLVEDVTVSTFASGQVLVVQNDSTGQTGNRYSRLRPIFIPSTSDVGTRFALRGSYSSAEAWENLDTGTTLSPTQLAANTDNYNPTGLENAKVLRLSTDASRDLTGIAGGFAGRELVIFNVGAQDLVLKNNATSTEANRFLLGADVTLGANESAHIFYDATSARWRAVGRHN